MASVIRCPHCGTRNRVQAVARGVPRCAKCHNDLPWVVDADSAAFGEEIAASVPVVADFWAAWCGPCRMVSPVLDALAEEHAGHLKVVKVDVDANPDLAQRYEAMSIPLLVVFRDGAPVERIVGALPRAQLAQRLAPYLAR
jgi:thioredoxin 2